MRKIYEFMSRYIVICIFLRFVSLTPLTNFIFQLHILLLSIRSAKKGIGLEEVVTG